MLQPSLLQTLRSLGDAMHAALEDDDLDVFTHLAQQREDVVDHLRTFGHPGDVDPDWEREAVLLQRQHQALTEAMAACQRRMGEALEGLDRFKKARRQYYAGPAPARSGILSESLRG